MMIDEYQCNRVIFLGLTLISAPHLSRSYHHLFPLEHFREVPTADMSSIARFEQWFIIDQRF
jgi:transcription factor Ssl1